MSDRYYIIITSIAALTTVIIILAGLSPWVLNTVLDADAVPVVPTPVSVLEACVGYIA